MYTCAEGKWYGNAIHYPDSHKMHSSVSHK